MTQGELYKKLDEFSSLKTTNITKKDTAKTGPLDFSKKRFRRAIHPIALIEIEKILDEAKKDFPVNTQVKSEKGYKEFMPTPFLYKKWFQKWFGSEQP